MGKQEKMDNIEDDNNLLGTKNAEKEKMVIKEDGDNT